MSAESIRNIKDAARERKKSPQPKIWPRKPRRTKKLAKRMRNLGKAYGPYLEKNPVCVIQSPVCTYHATVVNHKQGRGDKVVMDQDTWEPCCPPCNDYIESHNEWAVEHGHKESRIYKVR